MIFVPLLESHTFDTNLKVSLSVVNWNWLAFKTGQWTLCYSLFCQISRLAVSAEKWQTPFLMRLFCVLPLIVLWRENKLFPWGPSNFWWCQWLVCVCFCQHVTQCDPSLNVTSTKSHIIFHELSPIWSDYWNHCGLVTPLPCLSSVLIGLCCHVTVCHATWWGFCQSCLVCHWLWTCLSMCSQ